MHSTRGTIKTTHTGSLPRPADLVELLWRSAEGGEVDAEQLDALITDAVAENVRRQREIGLDFISDGEAGKPSFTHYIPLRYSGFGPDDSSATHPAEYADFPEMVAFMQRMPVSEHTGGWPACVGPIELSDASAVHRDIENLTAALGDDDPTSAFMNAPTPGQVAFNCANRHYRSDEEYLRALGDALRHEYDAIIDAGFFLQLDSPDIALAGHMTIGGVGEHREHIARAIEALNRAIDGLPQDRLRLHVCWGNYVSTHHLDVALRDIIEIILQANVKYLSFEAANPSHQHEWRVFEDVPLPDDQVLLPGVVDVQTPRLEHPQVIADRIRRFTDLVGTERVIACTDCGFGTAAGWDMMPPEVAWAKLERLVAGAELAARA